MFRLGAFENSLRSDGKKRIVRRVSDVQTRKVPKVRPPRIVAVQTKKGTPRSLESLTDSAVDVSSQEETESLTDPLLSQIWRLGKPKDCCSGEDEFESVCVVDPKTQKANALKQDFELEKLLEGLKRLGGDNVKGKKVKDLISNFEKKVDTEVSFCLSKVRTIG